MYIFEKLLGSLGLSLFFKSIRGDSNSQKNVSKNSSGRDMFHSGNITHNNIHLSHSKSDEKRREMVCELWSLVIKDRKLIEDKRFFKASNPFSRFGPGLSMSFDDILNSILKTKAYFDDNSVYFGEDLKKSFGSLYKQFQIVLSVKPEKRFMNGEPEAREIKLLWALFEKDIKAVI